VSRTLYRPIVVTFESTAACADYSAGQAGGVPRWPEHDPLRWFDPPGSTSLIARTPPAGDGRTTTIDPLLALVRSEPRFKQKLSRIEADVAAMRARADYSGLP
jgi:hypothetical protein